MALMSSSRGEVTDLRAWLAELEQARIQEWGVADVALAPTVKALTNSN